MAPTALSGALLLLCAPSAGSFSLFAPTPTLRRMQPRQMAVAAPNMMALPSFGGGQKKNTYQGPSEEVQNAFRMLGVSEEATYDEITISYGELCTKYKGETKRLIRLQAAKDIVLEDRLRQRMAGAYNSGISDGIGRNMDIGDNRKEEKEPLIKVPAWAENYMELPTKKLLLRNGVLFGCIALLSIVARNLAATACAMGDAAPACPPARLPAACPATLSSGFGAAGGQNRRQLDNVWRFHVCAGFGFGFFLLYNRGIPATSSTSIDEAQTQRDVAKKPVFIAAGLTIFMGALGGTLAQILPLAFLLEEATVTVGLVAGFFTSATFFKVQDDYV